MILPPCKESALPSKPGKEPLNEPSSAVATKFSSVLRFVLTAIFSMGSNHLNAVLGKFCIKNIAVVCLVSNQFLRPRFYHIKVKSQLYKSYFMMVRRMRGHRNRQAVTIDNPHYFQALTALRLADLTAAILGRTEHCIDEALPLVYASLFAKRIGQISQNITKHVASAPLLKSTMNRLIVRITLRQHMPLCP